MTGLHVKLDGATRGFGQVLREWRNARGMSQLALSVQANVSTRHLSYMETGRASPSRDMVLLLAQALEMPLREKNAFLQSAGFAPIYSQTPLEAHAMAPVRDAIDLLLRSTEPNPTFVVNRRYDVLNANETGRWILATFTEDLRSFPEPPNLGRLLSSPRGMRPYLENWPDVARKVFARLRRELGGAHSREPADEDLLRAIARPWEELPDAPATSDPSPLMVPVHLRRGSLGLRLFTTIATLGTPLDVTLQELRVEMLFPADETTKQGLENRKASGVQS
jgi:transcriptional regulator with XRE-family HTH domain